MARWLAYWGATLFVLLMSGCVAQSSPASTATGAIAPAQASAENSAASTELSGEIIVFAAASLTDAFGEIATNFQAKHPDVQLVYNFAGSQQLVQQLAQGAPADLFASANQRQMELAMEAGRVISGTQQTFVHNRLVVIYPSDNPAGLITLHDLAKPGLKLVLAAPEVPVGGYSLDFLNKASATIEYGSNYRETVLANVVSYEQNVRSVLSKVILGEADAGIVYTSDVTGDEADKVGQIEIPDELNTIADYPVAPIADSSNPILAEAFMEYLLSSQGQEVLAKHGFVPVGQ